MVFQMSEKVDLEELFNKLAEEKKTRELLTLPENFFIQKENNIKNNLTDEQTDNINVNNIKNSEKLLKNLKKIRIQKILLYLAYDRKLPTPIPSEEESLYKHINIILNKTTQRKTQNIKVINDIPEIITPEGKKLGPFTKGQTVSSEDEQETEFILKNNIGEIINA